MFPNPSDLLHTLDNFPSLTKALPWLVGTGALYCVPRVLKQLLELVPLIVRTVRRVPIDWSLIGIQGQIEVLKEQRKLDKLRSQTVLSQQSEPQRELPYRTVTPLLEMPEKVGSLGS